MTETASTYNCSTLYPDEGTGDKANKSKSEVLQIRLSQKQKQKIENYARFQGRTVSEIMRNYIDRLANK